MPLDKALLKQSLDLVMASEPHALEHFYGVLFTRHPRALLLFHRRDIEEQQSLLFDALSWCIDHIDDWGELGRYLVPLGEKHLEYGITREMYDWVGDALIDTLAGIAGVVWSDELELSWRKAYAIIANTMLAASEGPTIPTPRPAREVASRGQTPSPP